MNDLDSIYEIVDRIQKACIKAEEIGNEILQTLEHLSKIEEANDVCL